MLKIVREEFGKLSDVVQIVGKDPSDPTRLTCIRYSSRLPQEKDIADYKYG